MNNKKYFMTFGTEHNYPYGSQLIFFGGCPQDAHDLFSSVLREKDGAYAFIYTEEEFNVLCTKDNAVTKKNIKGYVFDAGQEKEVIDIADNISIGTPITIKSSLFADIKGKYAGKYNEWVLLIDEEKGRTSIPIFDVSAIIFNDVK